MLVNTWAPSPLAIQSAAWFKSDAETPPAGEATLSVLSKPLVASLLSFSPGWAVTGVLTALERESGEEDDDL